MFKGSKPNLDDVPFVVAKGNSTSITVMGVCLVVLLLSNVFFAVVAAKQYQRKEKTPEPIIFEVDTSAHKIVRVEKGNLGATKQSLLRSVTLRDYVFDRETINHIDEKDRWKKIRLMSNKKVWGEFQTLMNPEINKNSVILNNKLKRKIEVITDYPLDHKQNIHRVEFYATDFIDDERFPPQRYVAVIQYDTGDAFVSYEDRFINIDGLKIVRYEIYGA
ncbi:type IV secretion system protein [Vibrio ordalii]|uniref:type IV secretion system protein n=1 Tax=Vibrio ordalii TaxID=28174 RepID=UPI00024835C8|nr:type IV secretion system protein [Vibrio ordalii]